LRIRDNLIIHVHRRSRLGLPGAVGIMDTGLLKSWVKTILTNAGIKANPMEKVDSLSGGMQQRIILMREFAENAAFLVLANPGWGLDHAGRARLIREIGAQTEKGTGVLVFSTDVDELLSVSDEILVLRNGEFSDHISLAGVPGDPDPDTVRGLKERIGRAMIGEANND
jgi:simple sugar transport system ATP-binding protein